MDAETEKAYQAIRSGRAGFYEQQRGLIAVWGKEAVQFLDGMATNSVKTLEDGVQMLAAFPNAQGRLLALTVIKREGDKFLIETEEASRERLFQNLFRFTFAGDFFVEDRSESHSYFEIFGPKEDVYRPNVGDKWPNSTVLKTSYGAAYVVPNDEKDTFRSFLVDENGCLPTSDELYERLRIEAGVPKFGIDMDEETIVPELALEGMVSYEKGCYIGQEIIARIHFRGHVAKQLTGITSESPESAAGIGPGIELMSSDGKPAGKVTSSTYSPALTKNVALAFVRYDYLAAGTELNAGASTAVVTPLPFIK